MCFVAASGELCVELDGELEQSTGRALRSGVEIYIMPDIPRSFMRWVIKERLWLPWVIITH